MAPVTDRLRLGCGGVCARSGAAVESIGVECAVDRGARVRRVREAWPETALFSDAHPFSDTDSRKCTSPTTQYRGLGGEMIHGSPGSFHAMAASTRNSLKLRGTDRTLHDVSHRVLPLLDLYRALR
jgi:hypothetical protein